MKPRDSDERERNASQEHERKAPDETDLNGADKNGNEGRDELDSNTSGKDNCEARDKADRKAADKTGREEPAEPDRDTSDNFGRNAADELEDITLYESEMKAALELLESVTRKETPSAEWFASYVAERQAEQKRAFRRDLMLFFLVSPLAVLLTMGAMAYGPVAMLIFQSIVLGLISLPAVLRRRKKVDG